MPIITIMSKKHSSAPPEDKRKPGRPPTYVFSKPDSELSENERRLKSSVIKRRQRQNRSYHRKKRAKELATSTINELNNSLQSPSASAWPPTPPPTIPPYRPPSLSHTELHKRQWPDLNPHHSVPAPRWTNPISHHLPNSAFSSISGTASDAGWASSSLPARQVPFAYPQQTLRTDAYESTKACLSSSNTTLPITSTYSLTTPHSHSLPAQTPYIEPVVHSHAPYVESQPPPIHSYGTVKPPPKHHPASAPIDEKDEDCLLDEMLNASADRTIAAPVHQPPKPTPHQDILVRLSSLPKDLAEGLKDLALFPSSFDAESALAVMGLRPENKSPGIASQMLRPLVHLNLAVASPGGRYILNESAKRLTMHTSAPGLQEARKRFVAHFITKMERLGSDSVNRLGKDRLNAMKLYDMEQGNMRAALQMCHEVGGKKMVVNFLAKGATIMRYAIAGHERIEVFSEALREIEKMKDGERSDCEEEVRILLALSEAHFDVLGFKEAEDHLSRAIALMAGEHGTVSVSSSVLALLLLGEVKIRGGKFSEAEKILLQALNSLKSANLQESTFGVCCLLSLVSIYISTDNSEQALRTGSAAVSTLRQLGFSEMPIYADALATLGTVHFTCGRLDEAVNLFRSGLGIMDSWMTDADWANTPYQHCTFLDIFLMECIGQTYVSQNRREEANGMMVGARQKRSERRLPGREEVESSPARGRLGNVFSRLYARHVY